MFSFFLLIGCAPDGTETTAGADIEALEARIATLESALGSTQAALADAQADVASVEADVAGIRDSVPEAYTDEDAVAAVQNDDPAGDPDRANLAYLWSQGDYGYQWLEHSRWTMDNRSNPAGEQPRHELVQAFHETPQCTESSAFADCNSTAAMKYYVNGPSVEDNDWSADGYAKQAMKNYHTHASGIYMVSFGQASTVTDVAGTLIAPSGIHLEPWGAHQAVRIDGSQNSGENVRIDTTLGSTGIAIYESPLAATTCSIVRTDCEESWPLYLRGGTVHLEDVAFERSVTDGRGTGVESVHTESLGIEHFYAWHDDATSGLPVHCTWNNRVTDSSVIRLHPYTTSPELRVAHSYALARVWAPGNAPAECLGTQLIKTDAAGVYGYVYSGSTIGNAGFSVAILGPSSTPLNPGEWGELDRPSFLYEVLEPL